MENQTLALKDLVGNHMSFLAIFQEPVGVPEFISMEISAPAVRRGALDRIWNIWQVRVQLLYSYSNATQFGKS